jgi:type II secretory pathway component GspD/PulD (secretin)
MSISHGWRRALPLALLWLLATSVGAEELRVIPLKHRTAAEIMPLIRPLLGPDDALSGTDYRLIVRTSDKNLREIERVLAQLDVAQRNLILTVKHVLARDATATLARLSGEKQIGNHGRLVVAPDAPRDGRGATVEQDGLRLSARRDTVTRADERTQVVRVLDGKPAYIRVGQSVPHITKILSSRKDQVTLTQGVEYQNVTSGFQVLPRVRGEQVLLEIAPRLASLQDPATGLVNFQELATTVTLKFGDWIDLGAVLGTHDAVSNAILESGTDTATGRWTILVRVEDATTGAGRGTPAPDAPAWRR